MRRNLNYQSGSSNDMMIRTITQAGSFLQEYQG